MYPYIVPACTSSSNYFFDNYPTNIFNFMCHICSFLNTYSKEFVSRVNKLETKEKVYVRITQNMIVLYNKLTLH